MPTTRRRVDWSFGPGHGPVSGVLNAAGAALAATMVADLAHISPLYAALAGVCVGAASVAAAAVADLPGAAICYRAACWLAAGGWSAATLAWSSPWRSVPLALLGIGSLAAGMIGAGLARSEGRARRAREIAQQRAQLLSSGAGRARLAAVWEDRLARVCSISGARVIGVETWAQRTGYDLEVVLPPGGHTWRRVDGFKDGLAADARLPNGCGVEVKPGVDRGTILIGVSTVDALAEPREYQPTTKPRTISNPFPVGWHRDGADALAELRFICGLISGQTGSGKTNIMQVVNARLVECVDTLVWAIDTAGAGIAMPWVIPWLEGRAPRPAMDWVAADDAAAETMCRTALDLIAQRKIRHQGRMRAVNDDKVPLGRSQVDDLFVAEVVVVVDEFAKLPPKIQDLITEISDTGRATGVRTLVGALRATGDVVPTGLRKQAALRVGMRVQDEEELAYLFGWRTVPAAEDAPHEGCGHLVLGQSPPRAFRADRITPTTIDRVAVTAAAWRPALEAGVLSGQWQRAYDDRWDATLPILLGEPVEAAKGGAAATAAPTVREQGVPLGQALADMEDARRRMMAAAEAAASRTPDGVEVDWSIPEAWLKEAADHPSIATEQRPDAHTRMLQLVGEYAERGGVGPTELVRRLRDEGYGTAYQTVVGWLKDDVAKGLLVQPGGDRKPYFPAPGGGGS